MVLHKDALACMRVVTGISSYKEATPGVGHVPMSNGCPYLADRGYPHKRLQSRSMPLLPRKVEGFSNGCHVPCSVGTVAHVYAVRPPYQTR